MRLQKKNTKLIHYKLYQGLTETIRDGMQTGEYTKSYSSMYSEEMNVSPASGVSSLEMFGDATSYSKVAMTCNMNCPLKENAIVWVDNPTTGANDYLVVQVSRSINNIAYALREVDVNE